MCVEELASDADINDEGGTFSDFLPRALLFLHRNEKEKDMFKRLITTALLFGMAATAPPAYAASCAMRDTLVEGLKSKFSETLTAGGLQGSQTTATLIEVWASEQNGTFTVIITNPQGVSCVVAAGTDWFQSDQVAGPDDTPS